MHELAEEVQVSKRAKKSGKDTLLGGPLWPCNSLTEKVEKGKTKKIIAWISVDVVTEDTQSRSVNGQQVSL